jgi:hypothetical protein
LITIAAVLCWYDEPVEALRRCVESLGWCDMLVEADGPWEYFDGPVTSPPEQRQALNEACSAVGLPQITLTHHERYPSQVAKRDRLYREAAREADWIFIIDGDEYVERVFDIRAALAGVQEDAVVVGCDTHSYLRAGRVIRRDEPHRRLFRTAGGLSVQEAHNGIVTDDGRWLGGPRRIAKEPAADLQNVLMIRHEHWSRPMERNQRSATYYRERSRLRIEIHG